MKSSGTGCVVNVWTGTKTRGLGVLYWPCDTHPQPQHTLPTSSFFPLLYWRPLKINKNDLGVHPPFGCIILEVPSLGYSGHTVQWASRARVICHWFPPSSCLSLPDSLAPSQCTQHKKLTSSYTLLMHRHNNPLFSCPLVISLFLYLFRFLSLSSFISSVLPALRAPALFLKSLHRSLFFHSVMDDLCKCCVCPTSFFFLHLSLYLFSFSEVNIPHIDVVNLPFLNTFFKVFLSNILFILSVFVVNHLLLLSFNIISSLNPNLSIGQKYFFNQITFMIMMLILHYGWWALIL